MAKQKTLTNPQAKIPLSTIILALSCLALIIFWGFEILSPSPKHLTDNLTSEQGKNLLVKSSLVAPPKPNSTPSASKKTSILHVPQNLGYQLKVPMLMYHYIGNNPNPADHARDILSTTPDKFEEEMKYIHDNGYITITLDTLYAALKKQITLPNKAIVLTFDDGYIDFYYNAYPILRKYNLQATEFIPTGLMDQGYYLRWSQIQEMQASGFIHFEAHSVHHYSLPSLSKEKALAELVESKTVLQNKLGVPVNFMAYPFGTVNDTVIKLTKQAGYVGSAGTWASKIQSEGTIFNMPRLRINGSINLQTFSEIL